VLARSSSPSSSFATMRFFFASSCTLALGASASGWPWEDALAHHEGVAVHPSLKHCVATPQVSVNREDYEQFYWQHCNGTIFTASYNDQGEGLQGDRGTRTLYSKASPLVEKAHLLSAAQDSGLVVLQNGDVMAFGKNNYEGRLGIGEDLVRETIYDGAKVVLPGKVKSVSAANERSYFVTTDGKAYVAGRNTWGEFCRPKTEIRGSGTPLLVPLPEDAFVVDVSAARHHTLFLTKDGRVYGCGSNDHGMLGTGKAEDQKYDSPQLVWAEDIVAIATGITHSVFLQKGGRALVVGSNSHGAIGLGEDVAKVNTPTKLSLEHVVAISAGSDHSMFLLCDGTVYGTGQNDYFQLAVGHNEDVYTPTKTYYENVVAMAVSGYLGMFMTSDGELHISGTYEYYEVAFPFGAEVTGFDWKNKHGGGDPHSGLLKQFELEQQNSPAVDSAIRGTGGFLPGFATGALGAALLSIVSAALLPTIQRAMRSRSERADMRPLVETEGSDELGKEGRATSGEVGEQVC